MAEYVTGTRGRRGTPPPEGASGAFALGGQFLARVFPGDMQTTIALKRVFCGTEQSITQEEIPEGIPAELCYLGWQGIAHASRVAHRVRNSGMNAG